MLRTKKNNQQGFTLIELVAAILLMGIISVIIAKILLQNYQIFLTSQNVAEVDWQGFIALERMTDDVHNIRSANDISTIQTSQFAFTDVNGNSVQYQLSGNLLLRNGQTLASGVQSLTLSYLAANGTTTATPSLVRYVSLSAALTQGNISTSFATMVGTRGMQ